MNGPHARMVTMHGMMTNLQPVTRLLNSERGDAARVYIESTGGIESMGGSIG